MVKSANFTFFFFLVISSISYWVICMCHNFVNFYSGQYRDLAYISPADVI